MQVVQEIRGGFGLGGDVDALVDESILRKPVEATGLRHELPQADRARGRARRRIEAALDHREPHEIERHVLAAKDAFDRVSVTARATDANKRAHRARANRLLYISR